MERMSSKNIIHAFRRGFETVQNIVDLQGHLCETTSNSSMVTIQLADPVSILLQKQVAQQENALVTVPV